MKIGYPCINRSIGCTANSSFRLASFSKEKLIATAENNLDCLFKILKFNLKNNFMFFRISSKLIPFASHPICKINWEKILQKKFEEIGKFIKKHNFRISMHPDQFVLINALDLKIVKKSIRELEYHCKVLNSLKLDSTAKIQIHVGGVYGDKKAATARFIKQYKKLSSNLKKRLVIENDDYKFNLKDCLEIHKQIKIPIVFDTLHHQCLNNGETFKQAIKLVTKTWAKKDGIPIIDYSNQAKNKRKGSHSEKINVKLFKDFLKETASFDFDIMLEIKDKEKSALKVIKILKELKRQIN